MDTIFGLLIIGCPICVTLIGVGLGIYLEWLTRRRGPGPTTDALGFLSAICWISALMALAVSLLLIWLVVASEEELFPVPT